MSWATEVRFQIGAEIFLFATASRQDLEPTQPSNKCVLGTLSPVIRQLEREFNH